MVGPVTSWFGFVLCPAGCTIAQLSRNHHRHAAVRQPSRSCHVAISSLPRFLPSRDPSAAAPSSPKTMRDATIGSWVARRVRWARCREWAGLRSARTPRATSLACGRTTRPHRSRLGRRVAVSSRRLAAWTGLADAAQQPWLLTRLGTRPSLPSGRESACRRSPPALARAGSWARRSRGS